MSSNTNIDFLQNSCLVQVYFDNSTNPQICFHAEREILERNQPHGKSFKIQVMGKSCRIVISTTTNLDISGIIVQEFS